MQSQDSLFLDLVQDAESITYNFENHFWTRNMSLQAAAFTLTRHLSLIRTCLETLSLSTNCGKN